jgi:flagellin
MRTLAMQASNDTNTASDRANLNDELTDLQAEITRIADTATFNNQNLLEGTMSGSKYQIGHKTGETVALSIADFKADSLGSQGRVKVTISGTIVADETVKLKRDQTDDYDFDDVTYTVVTGDTQASVAKGLVNELNKDADFSTFYAASIDPKDSKEVIIQRLDGSAVTHGNLTVTNSNPGTGTKGTAASKADLLLNATSVTTRDNAQEAVVAIDNALNEVSRERANLGAFQNRLEHAVSNMMNMSANTADARSVIADADYAQESSVLAKNQILQQAGTAMLAQANAQAQTVLSLLK